MSHRCRFLQADEAGMAMMMQPIDTVFADVSPVVTSDSETKDSVLVEIVLDEDFATLQAAAPQLQVTICVCMYLYIYIYICMYV